jgi:magnesium chelatase family protein
VTIGRTTAVALIGLEGAVVDVEADIAAGLPRFAVVGLPDRSLMEATDRVRAAIVNSQLQMPTQRVTVNLSPAALPKAGSGFDLSIAMAALAATGQVPPESVSRAAHIGELALDGRLRPTRGVLPAVVGAARAGIKTILVPQGNLPEAQLVPGIQAVGVSSLRNAAIWHGADLSVVDVPSITASQPAPDLVEDADLADVVGNRDAVSALIACAAGGHHLFMLGPPGAGKTMLASRLRGILPDLSEEASLEVACVNSVVGGAAVEVLPHRPPFEAPHHTATTTSLVGGGSGVIRPGAIAKAAHGVLFLDEAPEFSASTLDALRQPLENGSITIHRSSMTATFPARFLLVLAANPCPCGNYGLKAADCTCPPFSRRRYLARLSGPLLDRVDVHLTVDRISHLSEEGYTSSMTTAQARARVSEAREIARERWRSCGFAVNAAVPGRVLRGTHFHLGSAVLRPLDRALGQGAVTMRGYDRTLRLAWTLADLDQAGSPSIDHIGRALLLRRGIS